MPASLIPIGLGAGAASALLYASAASGSPFAIVLFYVAPLPILLAGVGWRHHAGLIAAAVAAAALALAVAPKTGLYYAVAVGIPCWWLAYLALLARPGATPEQTEWYPVGRLVIWCASLGALLVALSIPLVASSLEEYQAALSRAFEQALLGSGAERPVVLPGGQDPKAIIDLMARLAPGVAASFWTMSSLFNLWLAGRITRASKRLVRPWPAISALTLPKASAAALLGGFVGSLLPGLFGLIAELVAATFLIAYALLGLATLHVTSRAAPARGLVLFGLYATLVLLPWIAVLLASLGLAEQAFELRRRFGPPPPGPPPTAAANLP